MLELLVAVGGIILVDLVLSGDNALVIGAAAARLARRQRWQAIVIGGGGAILLRILFAFFATLLLQLPLLQAIGGGILLLIAIRLLMDREKELSERTEAQAASASGGTNSSASRGFLSAMLTILVADVTMSLDNVLAVGALAHGDLLVLAIGVFLSIVLLLFGSAIVAELIGRLTWLLDVAALVLAWTGANMVLDDRLLGPFLNHYPWTGIAIPVVAFVIVLAADVFLRVRDSHRISSESTRYKGR